ICLLGDHLVEENVDDPRVEASLGFGAGGRVMVLWITQEDVQLVPEPFCLRIVPCAKSAPNADTRLTGRLVPPRRMPEDDRVARPTLGLTQACGIASLVHGPIRCSNVVPAGMISGHHSTCQSVRNNVGTTHIGSGELVGTGRPLQS